MTHTIDFNLLKSKIERFENNKKTKNENQLNDEMILKKNGDLYLIKYDKKYINDKNINTLGKYRSVIFDKNKLVSFSPPKSLRFNNKRFWVYVIHPPFNSSQNALFESNSWDPLQFSLCKLTI